MRACAALITVNDPLLMDCVLARYRPALAACRGETGSHAGAGYYEGKEPVLLREPVPASGRVAPRLPDRVLSRQFFASTVAGAPVFRAEDTPPLRFRQWLLVVGGRLDPALHPPERLAIPLHLSRSVSGTTAAEQLLHQFYSFLQGSGDIPEPLRVRAYHEALASTLSLDEQWFRDEPSRDLTVLLGDGCRAVGATLGRPLWYERIDGLEECPICRTTDGQSLAHPDLRCTVVLDTDRAPAPDWHVIEQNHIFTIDRAGEIEIAPLSV